MKKMRAVSALLVGLVLVLGLLGLMAGAQAPHKQGKHLAAKTPFQSVLYKGFDKSMAEKATPCQRTRLEAWGTVLGLVVFVVGVLAGAGLFARLAFMR